MLQNGCKVFWVHKGESTSRKYCASSELSVRARLSGSAATAVNLRAGPGFGEAFLLLQTRSEVQLGNCPDTRLASLFCTEACMVAQESGLDLRSVFRSQLRCMAYNDISWANEIQVAQGLGSARPVLGTKIGKISEEGRYPAISAAVAASQRSSAYARMRPSSGIMPLACPSLAACLLPVCCLLFTQSSGPWLVRSDSKPWINRTGSTTSISELNGRLVRVHHHDHNHDHRENIQKKCMSTSSLLIHFSRTNC